MDNDPVVKAPPEWVAAIERSQSDLAADRTLPMDDVLGSLQQMIDEMDGVEDESEADI